MVSVNRPERSAALFLMAVSTALSALAQQTSVPPSGIRALVLQLASPEKEWGSAARLQKLGAPAAAALVANLREDGFRDRDHGNHSPTMRALEKIGEPAVAEIDRVLSPALFVSTNP